MVYNEFELATPQGDEKNREYLDLNGLYHLVFEPIDESKYFYLRGVFTYLKHPKYYKHLRYWRGDPE